MIARLAVVLSGTGKGRWRISLVAAAIAFVLMVSSCSDVNRSPGLQDSAPDSSGEPSNGDNTSGGESPNGKGITGGEEPIANGGETTPGAGGSSGPSITSQPPPPGEPSGTSEEPQPPPSTSNEVIVGPAFSPGPKPPVDFGSVVLGTSSDQVVITVKNGGGAIDGDQAVIVTAININGENPQDFGVERTDCLPNVELARGETCKLGLVFSPISVGKREASLQIMVSGGFGNGVGLLGLGLS